MVSNIRDIRHKQAPSTFATHSRGFTAVINTDDVDDEGEVLLPRGMLAESFRGAVLWGHDANRPIGKIVGGFRQYDDRVEASVEYAIRPATHPKDAEWFPDTVKAMVEQGIVKGVSVGFLPVKDGYRKASKADRSKYGGDVEYVHSRWKLLELSVTPLNCNPGAVITAVNKSLLTKAVAESILGVAMPHKRRVILAI